MPIEVFGKTFDDWDSAHSYVMSQGYTSDQADKIVGKAKSEQESLRETVTMLRQISNTNLQETKGMEKGCLLKLCDLPRDQAYQEAQKLLDDNKASKIVRYTVGLALRMTDTSEKKLALQEAESQMEDEEKKKTQEGNAPTGTSTQSTSTTDVAADVSDRLHDIGHPEGAQSAPGKNHGEGKVRETEDGEFDMGACVMRHVADGKTPEEARKACGGEKEAHYRHKMTEAIKEVKYFKTEVVPALKEAIKTLDGELKKVQEAIKNQKGVLTFEKPMQLPSQKRTQETTGQNTTSTPPSQDIESMRNDIASFDDFLENLS